MPQNNHQQGLQPRLAALPRPVISEAAAGGEESESLIAMVSNAYSTVCVAKLRLDPPIRNELAFLISA